MGEFGRTPQINHRFGRDHWSHTWSCVVGGAGFPRGAVYGKTSANGTEVSDGNTHSHDDMGFVLGGAPGIGKTPSSGPGSNGTSFIPRH